MDSIESTSNNVPEELPVQAPSADRPPVPPAVAATPELAGMHMEEWDYQQPRRGQIRSGVILSKTEQEIVVGIDAKRDAVVPSSDLQRLGADALARLSVGDSVDVYVLSPEDQDGNLVASLFRARSERAWEVARQLAESGECFEGQVVGYNKGGLVVPVEDVRGFVPSSQVPGLPQNMSQEDRLRRLAGMVGQTLPVKVIEINRTNRRLILSATAAQRDTRKVQREKLLQDLREGEVRKGIVSSLCSFGAFVDLGGADGLIHLSELSWRQVRHPREVVNVGDEVEVYVLRLDPENQRIALSLKRLQPEPWALVEDKYELGQLVQGRITNVAEFGAFAQIEEGIEGLIHVSELSEAPITNPRDVVKRGDVVLLRIIRIDLRRKRLGLSLKRVLESEWAEWAASLPPARTDSRDRRRSRSERPERIEEESQQETGEPPVEAAAPEPESYDIATDLPEPELQESEMGMPGEAAEEMPSEAVDG